MMAVKSSSNMGHKIYMVLRSIRPEYYLGYYIFGLAMLLLPNYGIPSLAQIIYMISILSFAGAYAMMWNILGDSETDLKVPHKRFMAETVKMVGQRNIIALAMTFGSLLIIMHLIGLMTNLIKDGLASTLSLVIGMTLAYVYSINPFRTKSKPILGLITTYILIFVTQTFYILSLQTVITKFEISLVLSLSLLWLASTVITSQLEDSPFDKLAGVTTFSSVYNPRIVISTMLILTIVGAVASYFTLQFISGNPIILGIGIILLPLIIELRSSLLFLRSNNYHYFRYVSPAIWFITNIFLLMNDVMFRW